MFNQATIIGRAGREPELKYTQSGKAVATMSVATNETWYDKEGAKQTRTEWHNVTCWGKLAENVAQYVAKGALVLVVGKIQTDKWEKDGANHYSTKIVADTVRFLSKRGETSGDATPDAPPTGAAPEDDDLPF